MSNKVIAIDGPGGSGKSTVAKLLAKKLSFDYLDTGAMYRAVTWLALKKKIDVNDSHTLSGLASRIDISFSENRVYVNKEDVTEQIRKPEIDKNVSYVARIKGVREAMVALQRKIAEEGRIIVDGRDIGSRVLPDADIKVYLTASLEERAARRFQDIRKEKVTLSDVKKELKKRDMIDKNRKISPLVKADDACYLDTTNMSIEQVIDKLLKLITGE